MSFLLTNFGGIVWCVFENINEKQRDHSWLANKAITSPSNEAVVEADEPMMNKFPGDTIVYTSCDSVEETAHG